MKILSRLLAHPLTAGLDINDPKTTEIRRDIIRSKPFLFRIYDEWYRGMADQIPKGEGGILEIGSGGGFLKDYVPNLITSDILPCEGVDLVVDACKHIPCDDHSLKALLMLNVLHHLPDPQLFLSECSRCLRPGGRLIMVESWVSQWSSLMYKNLHHEPFDASAPKWKVLSDGPLSGANGALPWIIFERDRELYDAKFPELPVESVHPMMPISYLASGGVSMRSLLPGGTYPIFRFIEGLLAPLNRRCAMFAQIVLRKA